MGGLFSEYQIQDTLAGRPWDSLEGNEPNLGVLGRACRKQLGDFLRACRKQLGDFLRGNSYSALSGLG